MNMTNSTDALASGFSDYKVGENDIDGERIVDIVGKTRSMAVYLVAESVKIHTDTAEMSEWEQKIYAVYDPLHSFIRRSLPKELATGLRRELGTAVFNALSQSEPASDAAHFFRDVRSNILEHSRGIARIYYLIFALSLALAIEGVLGIYFLYSYDPSRPLSPFFLGAVGGVLGAVTSIGLRASHLRPHLYAHRTFIAFQGCARIILGLFFGLILAAAVMGDVVLGFIGDSAYKLFLFCILAGFSETFVPELLSRLESTPENKNGQLIADPVTKETVE